jgi:hypothetical protein
MNKYFQSLAMWLRGAVATVILCGITPTLQAGLLETQNNPVSFGANYWGSPDVWDSLGVPKYALDPASDGTLDRDVSYISIVHDADYFYVRIHAAQGPTFGGDYNLWLDIDHNPATGQRHWSGNASIGAERLVTGAALIQDIPAWTIAWLNWDQSSWDAGNVERDIFFSINRATQMPGVTSFDFTYQFYSSPNSATGDWYPDAAEAQSGDFFRYTAGTALTTNFSGRTWTLIEQQTPLPTMGGQYDPIQTNSYATPDANTGLINGRFGIDSFLTTPVTINLGDTVEYDFFITTETRNLSGNNADTWFASAGTGFQDASGAWVTARNLRFSDSRNDDLIVSPSGAVALSVNETRSALQATHVKWVFTSLNTATVTLTLDGEVTPYVTYTNVFSAISRIAKFYVGLNDSEQDVTVANFTITAAGTPPPAVLVFSGYEWTPLLEAGNSYSGVNANAGLMTGNFAIDTALTTPVTLAVGDKVTYDYSLSEISRSGSTWVGDSRTGFQDGSGNWVSGRIATYNPRWEQYFEGSNPNSVNQPRGNPWTIHVAWVFTSTTTATVTLTLAGESAPFAVWNDTFSNIADIAQFRIGLWDSQQDVTLANFKITQPTGALWVDHHWQVGEDGLALSRDSIGGNHFDSGFGTISASTAIHAPGSTASLHFSADGGNWINNSPITVPASNWVIELWVNADATASPVSILTLGSDDTATQLGIENGNWAFVEMNSAFGDNSVPAVAGQWTHLAWVRDDAVNRFFVNGVQVGSDTASLVNNGRVHLSVRPNVGDRSLQGYVDEIRFSTFAPGQFDPNNLLYGAPPVSTHYNAIVLGDEPTALWRLAEASGPTADDAIGNNDGTYSGGVTFATAGALPGDPNPSAEFDGSSGYVAVPFAANLNPQGSFSIEAWVNPSQSTDGGGTPCPVSSAQMNSDRSGWQIRQRDTGWQFVLYTHSGSAVANDGIANTAVGGAPALNTWTHLVGVYNGTTTTLYVNGVPYSSSASGYVANYDDGVNPPGPFTVGARSSLNNFFTGRVDEVALYNRTLTATEVNSHFLNRPVLKIQTSGNQVTLSWPVGTLQEADEVTGTYTDVGGATSPHPVSASATKKFYQLKL